jgi:hypothetical protein
MIKKELFLVIAYFVHNGKADICSRFFADSIQDAIEFIESIKDLETAIFKYTIDLDGATILQATAPIILNPITDKTEPLEPEVPVKTAKVLDIESFKLKRTWSTQR